MGLQQRNALCILWPKHVIPLASMSWNTPRKQSVVASWWNRLCLQPSASFSRFHEQSLPVAQTECLRCALQSHERVDNSFWNVFSHVRPTSQAKSQNPPRAGSLAGPLRPGRRPATIAAEKGQLQDHAGLATGSVPLIANCSFF